MLQILAVDDHPDLKVHIALRCISKYLDFNVIEKKNLIDAEIFIKNNHSQIDLILLDMGFAISEDNGYSSTRGLDLLPLCRKFDIMVIINSTTEINDKEILESYPNVLKHVDFLEPKYLLEILEKNK